MENQTSPWRKRKPYRFFPLFALGFIFLGGLAVMLLWNAIIPVVIPSINPVSYWQATGLLLLCRILVGGFHKPAGRSFPGKDMAMRDKMSSMTEEERIKFKEEWKRRCGRN